MKFILVLITAPLGNPWLASLHYPSWSRVRLGTQVWLLLKRQIIVIVDQQVAVAGSRKPGVAPVTRIQRKAFRFALLIGAMRCSLLMAGSGLQIFAAYPLGASTHGIPSENVPPPAWLGLADGLPADVIGISPSPGFFIANGLIYLAYLFS